MSLPMDDFDDDDMLSQGELTIDDKSVNKTIVFRIYKVVGAKNFMLNSVKILIILTKALAKTNAVRIYGWLKLFLKLLFPFKFQRPILIRWTMTASGVLSFPVTEKFQMPFIFMSKAGKETEGEKIRATLPEPSEDENDVVISIKGLGKHIGPRAAQRVAGILNGMLGQAPKEAIEKPLGEGENKVIFSNRQYKKDGDPTGKPIWVFNILDLDKVLKLAERPPLLPEPKADEIVVSLRGFKKHLLKKHIGKYRAEKFAANLNRMLGKAPKESIEKPLGEGENKVIFSNRQYRQNSDPAGKPIWVFNEIDLDKALILAAEETPYPKDIRLKESSVKRAKRKENVSRPTIEDLKHQLEAILDNSDPTAIITDEILFTNGLADKIFEQDLSYDYGTYLKESEKVYLDKAKDGVIIIHLDMVSSQRSKVPYGFWKGRQGVLNARLIIRYLIDEEIKRNNWSIDRALPKKADIEWFRKHKLGGFLNQAVGNHPYEALKFAYPEYAYDSKNPKKEHAFHPWDASVVYWTDDLVREAIRHHVENRHYVDDNGNYKEDTYGFPIDRTLPANANFDWFEEQGLRGLLWSHFKNHVYEAIKFAYPEYAYDAGNPRKEHAFHPWDALRVNWTDDLIHEAVRHHVENRHYIDENGNYQEDSEGFLIDRTLAANVTHKWFREQAFDGILRMEKFDNNVYKVMQFVYPQKFIDGTLREEYFRTLLGRGKKTWHLLREISSKPAKQNSYRVTVEGKKYAFPEKIFKETEDGPYLTNKISPEYGGIYDPKTRQLVSLFIWNTDPEKKYVIVRERMDGEELQAGHLVNVPRWLSKTHLRYSSKAIISALADKAGIRIYDLPSDIQGRLIEIINEVANKFNIEVLIDYAKITGMEGLTALSDTEYPEALALVVVSGLFPHENLRKVIADYDSINKVLTSVSALFVRNLSENDKNKYSDILEPFRSHIEEQLKTANDRIIYAISHAVAYIDKKDKGELTAQDLFSLSQLLGNIISAQRDFKVIFEILKAFEVNQLIVDSVILEDGRMITSRDSRYKLLAMSQTPFKIRTYVFKPRTTMEGNINVRLLLRPRQIDNGPTRGEASIRWLFWYDGKDTKKDEADISLRLDRGWNPESKAMEVHLNIESKALGNGYHYQFRDNIENGEEEEGELFADPEFFAAIVENFVSLGTGIYAGSVSKPKSGQKGYPTALIGFWKPVIMWLDKRGWSGKAIAGVLGFSEEYLLFSGIIVSGLAWALTYFAGIDSTWALGIASFVRVVIFPWAHWNSVYRLTGQGKFQTRAPTGEPQYVQSGGTGFPITNLGNDDRKNQSQILGEPLPGQATWKDKITITALGVVLQLVYLAPLFTIPFGTTFLLLAPLLPSLLHGPLHNSFVAPLLNLALGLVGKDKRVDEEKLDFRWSLPPNVLIGGISGMTNREIRSGMANNRMVGVTAEKAVSDSGVKMRLAKELERSLLGGVAGSKTVSLTEYEMHLDAIVQHAVNKKETAKMAREKLEGFIKHGQAAKDEGSLVYEVSDEILRGVYPEQGRRAQNDRRGTQNDRMWMSEIASADVVSLAMTAQSDNSVFEKLARLHKSGKTLSDQDGLSGVFDELGINSEDKQKADLELVSFLIAADTVDNSLEKTLSAGIETYNETMGLYMTSDRIETNAKEGIITGIELTKNMVESKPLDDIDYGIIDKLASLAKLDGDEENQISRVPLIMPGKMAMSENDFLNILKTYDQQTNWDRLKGRIVFIKKGNIKDANGKLSVRETRSRLGLNKDMRLDLFILNRAEWNIAESDLVTHLLVMLTGALVYDATHQIDENVERLTYLKIQA